MIVFCLYQRLAKPCKKIAGTNQTRIVGGLRTRPRVLPNRALVKRYIREHRFVTDRRLHN